MNFKDYAAEKLRIAEAIDQLNADTHNLYLENLTVIENGTKVKILKSPFVHHYTVPYIIAKDNEQMNKVPNLHVGKIGEVTQHLNNLIGVKLLDNETQKYFQILVKVWQIEVAGQ